MPQQRLLHALQRLGRRADAGLSDGSLLERFVRERSEAAFEAILRRHGDMVLRLCRRSLQHEQDAEDAFQAVFLVLARDAVRITRRESLAGWLFGVAYHVSHKIMRKNLRGRALPVRDDDRIATTGPPGQAEQDELRRIIEEEIRALPDKFRAPVVLCYLEGHSNSEAAALLACPRGTVDSRLATARRRLHQRLLQRGVALGSTAVVASLWQGDGAAAAPAGLSSRTLNAVMEFIRTGSAAGAVSNQVLTIVAGVTHTMSTNKLSLIAALAVALTLAGGAGVAVYCADDKNTADTVAQKSDAAPPKPAQKPESGKAKPKASPKSLGDAAVAVPNALSTQQLQAKLEEPARLKDDLPANMTLREFLEFLGDRYGVTIRLDLAAFARMEINDAIQMYEQTVRLPVVRGLTVGDALREALAQVRAGGGGGAGDGGQPVGGQVTFRIRNGQIVIVPAYITSLASTGVPTSSDDAGANLPPYHLLIQEEGEPIAYSVEDKALADVLRELRRTTGANIVLDVRQRDKAKLMVSGDFNDVRLLAALRVLCDMCDLQPVALNNVYYVTSRENAERLQMEIDRRRAGVGPQFMGMGGLGLGGLGGLGGPNGGLGGYVLPPPAQSPAPKAETPKPPEKKQ
jgi:RNA polymerase sigma factor (sigma-70 family)